MWHSERTNYLKDEGAITAAICDMDDWFRAEQEILCEQLDADLG